MCLALYKYPPIFCRNQTAHRRIDRQRAGFTCMEHRFQHVRCLEVKDVAIVVDGFGVQPDIRNTAVLPPKLQLVIPSM